MNIYMFQIIGYIFTILLGTLLHFTYKLSNENKIVAIFSAVNESIFEHLKLTFFPILLFSIYEYFIYGKNIQNFIPVKTLSIIISIILILTLFYTYTGIIGQSYFFIDILIFIISVSAAYTFSYYFLNTSIFNNKIYTLISLLILVIMLLCFILFTFYPPKIALFKDYQKN